VFLGHAVAMVTYFDWAMIGQLFDAMIVASSNKEWL